MTADSAQTLGVKWETLPGSTSPASVENDVIWDSKGDLAVGSGANTASRLAAGTDGQVLTAASGQTLGVRWSTPAAGATATDPIFDAKGDLPVGTGADAAAKLAAGTNGYVLTADSAQSTGLKWAAPAVGAGSGAPGVATSTILTDGTTMTAYTNTGSVAASSGISAGW